MVYFPYKEGKNEGNMTPCTLNMNKAMFRQMRKAISIVILTAFISTSVKSPAYAQMTDRMPLLPPPGVMVHLSAEFRSAHLAGITVHPDNALQFDFLIHKGDQNLEQDQKQEEYKKLVKYFLASLTIPDEDQWVNLSPYEKSRIIKDDFGKTEMGRDLLAEDYLLKQITSSLIYPEDGLGKKFWDRIYQRAWDEYHTTDIPVNTFNKVWIVPDQAFVYESGNTAYIIKSHLKVMLEEDYLSLEKHSAISSSLVGGVGGNTNDTHSIGSQVIREIILPELEKEVNEGKNFANLRQMYSGMVLATWYKKVLKESLLGKVYVNKEKVVGVNLQDPKANEEIYQRYLKAFKKGVFNYIKEDVDKYTNEAIPRKYFSGGFNRIDPAMVGKNNVEIIRSGGTLPVGLDMAALASEGSLDKVTVAFNPSGSDRAMATKSKEIPEEYRNLPRYRVPLYLAEKRPSSILVIAPLDEKMRVYLYKEITSAGFPDIELIDNIEVAETWAKEKEAEKKPYLAVVSASNKDIANLKIKFTKLNLPVIDASDALKPFVSELVHLRLQAQGIPTVKVRLDLWEEKRKKDAAMFSQKPKATSGRVIDINKWDDVKGAVSLALFKEEPYRAYMAATKNSIKQYSKFAQIADAFAGEGKKFLIAFEEISETTARLINRLIKDEKSNNDIFLSLKAAEKEQGRNNQVFYEFFRDEMLPIISSRDLKVGSVDTIKDTGPSKIPILALVSSETAFDIKSKGDRLGLVLAQTFKLSTENTELDDKRTIRGNFFYPSWGFDVIFSDGAKQKLNSDKAQISDLKGGIDFNSANLGLQIKRNGNGVPLPLAQQDMAQLNQIQGFDPEIIEIKPAVNLPILSELQEKLQASSV